MVKINLTRDEAHWLSQVMISHEAMGDAMATKILEKLPIQK